MSTTMHETPCNCLTLRQASRFLTQRYDEAIAPSGLRITQYSILAVLHRLGPSSVQQLADALVMDRSTLGHNLRPIERSGLVALHVDPADRRMRRLALTARGQKALAAARPLWEAAQARFEAEYGAKDAEALRGLLRRMITEGTT
ncbi:Transcriptional regulator, MarR family protein [Minicystis rosea]|nr:Transcriptional regulator, MarR family protein [Minicystis rosea]